MQESIFDTYRVESIKDQMGNEDNHFQQGNALLHNSNEDNSMIS